MAALGFLLRVRLPSLTNQLVPPVSDAEYGPKVEAELSLRLVAKMWLAPGTARTSIRSAALETARVRVIWIESASAHFS